MRAPPLVEQSEPATQPALRAHRHAWQELLVVRRGRYRGEHADGVLTAVPGQVVWWPAGWPHRPLAADAGTELLLVRWQGASAQRQGLVIDDVHGRLLASATWLWEATHGVYSGTRIAEALLVCVQEECTRLAQPRADARLSTIHGWVLANLALPITRASFAHGVGCSPSSLAELLQRHLGRSPLAYVRHLRTQRALELIRGTRLPLSEIAALVGAGHPDVLTRWVRHASGRSPRAWRGAAD